jgi:hypothetical protein
MMRIQVYSNEGPSPPEMGDNHKSAKIGYDHLNTCSFFSLTTVP